MQLYGDLTKFDNKKIQKTRGCLIENSLNEQGLFVNDIASVYASKLIKKLFFDVYITSQGVVFNDLQTLPIKI